MILLRCWLTEWPYFNADEKSARTILAIDLVFEDRQIRSHDTRMAVESISVDFGCNIVEFSGISECLIFIIA